jgi:hypothetical protein
MWCSELLGAAGVRAVLENGGVPICAGAVAGLETGQVPPLV